MVSALPRPAAAKTQHPAELTAGMGRGTGEWLGPPRTWAWWYRLVRVHVCHHKLQP